MTFLYVKNGCPGCIKAREFLVARGEEYREVLVDNPLLEIGIEKLLKNGHILVPLLVRTNGRNAELFVPGGTNGSFFFAKVT